MKLLWEYEHAEYEHAGEKRVGRAMPYINWSMVTACVVSYPAATGS